MPIPLTITQQGHLNEVMQGFKAALRLQTALNELEHDRVETEYVLTLKVAEHLLGTYQGQVYIECPTKRACAFIKTVAIKSSKKGKKPKSFKKGVRSGRIDVVLFSAPLHPEVMIEAKIKVTNINKLQKDINRFTQIISVAPVAALPEIFGICIFPITARGYNDGTIRKYLANTAAKLQKGVNAFNNSQPYVVAELHAVLTAASITLPTVEPIDEDDPGSAAISFGYGSIPAAVTISRR